MLRECRGPHKGSVAKDASLVLSPSQTHRRGVIILTMSRAARPEHICWKRKKFLLHGELTQNCYLNETGEKQKCKWERRQLMQKGSRQQDGIDSKRKGWFSKQQSRERVEGSRESWFRPVGKVMGAGPGG